jgi:hypothetical protein
MLNLVVAAKEGNEDALHALLKRCEPLFLKFEKLPDGTRDQDLRQELYLAWYLALQSFDISRYCTETPKETEAQ